MHFLAREPHSISQLGGNAPFREFMKAYDPQTGGYKEGMTPYDTYHSWAASQYKEKVHDQPLRASFPRLDICNQLDAALAGKPWTPSPPPEGFGSPSNSMTLPNRPSSAQGLRKSRASNTGRSLRSDSASPASFSGRNSPAIGGSPSPGSGAIGGSYDQKAANESYFASLGATNASRPADLPPSQGGRYQGFGSTPTPPPGSQHPSFALSSANAPTLADLQENPVAALGKGWSLLSAAVVGASRAVSENVVRPGMERIADPAFQASMRGYVSEAGKRAGEVGRSANTWGRTAFGVDVADTVGGVVGGARDRFGGGPQQRGYGQLGMDHEEESSALYRDDEDDFFDFHEGSSTQQSALPPTTSQASTTVQRAPAKKADDWDDWKDF